MSDYKTNEPQWESTQHGWHAVASLCGGAQWTAYIEYIDAPYWRIWAGCMFRSLQTAQDWCRKEIENQLQRAEPPQPAAAESSWHTEPEAWRWLWDTLSSELGEARTTEIRTELAARLRNEGTTTRPGDCEGGA